FWTVDEVKEYIDILAMHKLNKFHWHLTDDQGWRIEIKKYPELTRVGSVRKETLIGHHHTSNEYDKTPHSGYYTQKQIREIVKYAADRYVTVIPEIELPGHAVAALTSYPWLGCKGEGYEVRRRWGISKEVFCPGKETTFEFLQNVFAEVLELFPSEFIHIGGDECPKESWKQCPLCQERIKAEGLKDEFELQSYTVRRMEKWLR
ncbi:beta-N-acetylhexosaminidase, partial [Alistipes communis]